MEEKRATRINCDFTGVPIRVWSPPQRRGGTRTLTYSKVYDRVLDKVADAIKQGATVTVETRIVNDMVRLEKGRLVPPAVAFNAPYDVMDVKIRL